jgi:hypothetical protein
MERRLCVRPERRTRMIRSHWSTEPGSGWNIMQKWATMTTLEFGASDMPTHSGRHAWMIETLHSTKFLS